MGRGRKRLPALLATVGLVGAACEADSGEGPAAGAEDAGPTVVDASGRRHAFREPPERIVSLVPSSTEILRALGAEDRLVGRTDFDTAAALEGLPSVGGGLQPSLETLVALEPDLVIRFAGESDRATPRRLDELGIPHLAVRPDVIADVRKIVRDLGAVVGAPGAADSLVRSIDRGLGAVRDRVRDHELRRVAFLLGGSPPWAAGPGTFIHELMEIGGGRNAFHDLDALYASVSPEELVARDLDLVLVPRGASPAGVPAGVPVREVSTRVETPGPDLARAAEEVARAIHPEAFP